jgi:hypothetical protein
VPIVVAALSPARSHALMASSNAPASERCRPALRDRRFASFLCLQDLGDASVQASSLTMQHGFVRHSLQQAVPELVANLGAVPPRPQDLCARPALPAVS